MRGDRCGNILINIREKDEHRERQCPQIVPRVSGHYRVKTWESHSGAPARNQAPGSFKKNRSIEHSGDQVLNTARDTEWNIHQDQIGAERERLGKKRFCEACVQIKQSLSTCPKKISLKIFPRVKNLNLTMINKTKEVKSFGESCSVCVTDKMSPD